MPRLGIVLSNVLVWTQYALLGFIDLYDECSWGQLLGRGCAEACRLRGEYISSSLVEFLSFDFLDYPFHSVILTS